MGSTCKFSYKVSGIDLMIILNDYFWFSPITLFLRLGALLTKMATIQTGVKVQPA